MYYHSLKQCSSGTALHEAALFGKADVVNLLLHCGKLDTASLVHQIIYNDSLRGKFSHPLQDKFSR